MKNHNLLIVLGIIVNIIVSACAYTPTPDIEATVKAAVAAALTALPTTPELTTTPLPIDTPTLPPTTTPVLPTSTFTPKPSTATSTSLPPTITPTLVPPTLTPTSPPPTATPTLVLPTLTPTSPPPTATPTLAPPPLTPTLLPPTATPTSAILSAPVLIEPPESDTAYAWFDGRQLTTFRWQWDGQLPPNSTFEVRIWLEGIDPTSLGAYDVKEVAILPPAEAQREREKREVEREKQYLITDEGNGIYWIVINTRGARGVRPNYSTYLWTVAVVQIDPYERIGLEAPPRSINIVYIDPKPTPVK